MWIKFKNIYEAAKMSWFYAANYNRSQKSQQNLDFWQSFIVGFRRFI